jgi:hypothetical protein
MNYGPFVQVKTYAVSKEKNAKKKPDHTFVVKIQIPMASSLQSLMVYNKTKSFQCMISTAEKRGRMIQNVIKEKGVMGMKAYFNVYVTKKKSLVVIKEPMLAPQPW